MRVREQPQPLDPSQPLAHSKHEAFAREVAKFKSYEAAARAAGYRQGKSFKAVANRLSQYPTIKARVEHLQKVSGVAAAVDSAFVQRKLLDIVDSYKPEEIKASDQIKALEMLCKVNGLFAPTNVAPTNPEGTEPWNGVVTDEDRVKALEAFLAKVKGKI